MKFSALFVPRAKKDENSVLDRSSEVKKKHQEREYIIAGNIHEMEMYTELEE